MSPPQEDPGLTPWGELARGLAGSFTARARGLLVVEFALARRDGEAFGALRTRGLANAQVARLEAGGLFAVIERDAPARYRMLTDGAETLAAGPAGRSADVLKITCGDRSYEARMSFLRNSAVARSPAGTQAARLRGGLAGRYYEAAFDAQDAGALPVAILLLYHTATLRRRAYLT